MTFVIRAGYAFAKDLHMRQAAGQLDREKTIEDPLNAKQF